jgi:hypothetical protein
MYIIGMTTTRKITAIDVFDKRVLLMYEDGNNFGLATNQAISRLKESGTERIGVFVQPDNAKKVERIAKAIGYTIQPWNASERFDFVMVKEVSA